MDAAGLFTSLTSIGLKTVYSVVLAAIVLFCAAEFYRIWFDRTPVLAAFDFIENGTPNVEGGRSFAKRLVHEQYLLRTLLTQQSGYEPIQPEAEDAETQALSLEQPRLRVIEVEGSALDDIQLEAYGFNVSDLLRQLRNWVSQPNRITGRLDRLDDRVSLFATWRRRGQSEGEPDLQIYERAHDSVQTASFDFAAHLIWHNIRDQQPEDPLTRDMLRTIPAHDFGRFMRAFSVYQRASTDNALPLGDDGEVRQALADVETIIEKRTGVRRGQGAAAPVEPARQVHPPLYFLAANLQLLLTAPQQMEAAMRRRVEGDLEAYQTGLVRLGLAADANARAQLAALRALRESGPAAGRVASAFARATGSTARVSLPPGEPEAPVEAGESRGKIALAGARIGPAAGRTAGSACCVVEDQKGVRFLVTARYLFPTGKTPLIGSPVISPAAIDGGDEQNRIGVLERFYPEGEDAPGIALIRLAEGIEVSNELPGLGPVREVADPPAAGTPLKLFGRSSVLREGRVRGEDARLQPSLVASSRMSAPGDGGAPILDESNRLIGLQYAAAEDIGGFLPLKPIFEALGLRLIQD
jgi:hypothetical protein